MLLVPSPSIPIQIPHPLSRLICKPMHLQPILAEYESVGGDVAEEFFKDGLCLPSGSNLSETDLDRVVSVVRAVAGSR